VQPSDHLRWSMSGIAEDALKALDVIGCSASSRQYN
jgi:hypothetical protein